MEARANLGYTNVAGGIVVPYQWPSSAGQPPIAQIVANPATMYAQPLKGTLVDCYLEIPKITLTNAGLSLIQGMMVNNLLTYPVIRAETSLYRVTQGAPSINQNVFGHRPPAAVLIHFVPFSHTQMTVKDRWVHPYTTTPSNNMFGAVANVWPINIVSLKIQTPTIQIPAMYPIARVPCPLAGGANHQTYAVGGTEVSDYRTYSNLTKQFAAGKDNEWQPFLPYPVMKDGNLCMFSFNMSQSQQPFIGRLQVASTAPNFEVQANLGAWQRNDFAGAPIPPFDTAMYVTTFANEVVTYNAEDGRTGASWLSAM